MLAGFDIGLPQNSLGWEALEWKALGINILGGLLIAYQHRTKGWLQIGF